MMNKEAINGVIYGITVAKGIIRVAMDELEDYGFDDSELEAAKEYLQEGIIRLDIAYDIVGCAEGPEEYSLKQYKKNLKLEEE